MESPSFSISDIINNLDGRLSLGTKSLFDIVAATNFVPVPVYREPYPMVITSGSSRTHFEVVTYKSDDNKFLFTPVIESAMWSDWGMTLNYFMWEQMIHEDDTEIYGTPPYPVSHRRHSCLSVDVRGYEGHVTIGWNMYIGQARIPILPYRPLPQIKVRGRHDFWEKANPKTAFERSLGDELWKAVMLLRAAIDYDDPELKLRPFFARQELGEYLFPRESKSLKYS